MKPPDLTATLYSTEPLDPLNYWKTGSKFHFNGVTGIQSMPPLDPMAPFCDFIISLWHPLTILAPN